MSACQEGNGRDTADESFYATSGSDRDCNGRHARNGLEIALALVSAGANVVVTGRSQIDLEKAQQRAALAANAGQLHGVDADVRIMDDCNRVLDCDR